MENEYKDAVGAFGALEVKKKPYNDYKPQDFIKSQRIIV